MTPWKFLSLPAAWTANDAAGRRATWLELFFDLSFVAAIAQVGSPLHANYSFATLARYAFLFFLIRWAWLGHTLYSTRFDTDDPVQRALTLVHGGGDGRERTRSSRLTKCGRLRSGIRGNAHSSRGAIRASMERREKSRGSKALRASLH